MSFVLRAALVIGALFYFAAQRETDRAPGATIAAVQVTVTDAGAPSILNAVPVEARERILRQGAAEIARQLQAPSEDTLQDSDRRPAWRGVAGR